MRRPGTGSARRGGFRGFGGAAAAADQRLLVWTEGAFGRVDAGSYVADASTAAWYEIDEIRNGTKGVLVEPERKSYLVRGRWLTSQWTAANGGSVLTPGSATAGTAPDGTTPALVALGNLTVSQVSQTMGAATLPNGTTGVVSFYARGVVGGELLKIRVQGKDGVNRDSDLAALTTSWVRYTFLVTVGTGAGSGVVRIMSRNTASPNFHMWGAEYTEVPWSRTPTDQASTGALVSYPDVLTFLAAQVPLQLREGLSEWAITPHWAPDDLVSGDTGWLFTIGAPATDGVRWRHTGTDVRIEAVIGGSVVATSPALTGSTGGERRTILLDAEGGIISVNDVAGATGTTWDMPGGLDLCVGGAFNTGDEFDGYIEEPVSP